MGEKFKKILVLMSTYNGEKYLAEQIESILNQQYVVVDILVRDDGSTDKTVDILKSYEQKGFLRYITGENLKPAQSFRRLIDNCDFGYDFYAFSDQDDIWEKNKLLIAAGELSAVSEKVPCLWYCGLVPLIEKKHGKPMCCSLEKARSFEAVTDTFSTTNGCTMVFNELLLLALRSCKQGEIDMHDSWTHAMCLACAGIVLSNDTPLIQYRIHMNQVLGGRKDSLSKKLFRFIHASKLRKKTVEVMLTSNCIAQEKRTYLELLSDYDENMKHKLILLLWNKHVGLSAKEFMKFKMQILTNTY